MRVFAGDLHIHTALSPCASDEMTPPAIARAARDAGLALIAICDHNAAGNVAAVQAAAGDSPVVLAGMEVTTAEEVHLLGLFPDAPTACRAANEVQRTLPAATPADEQHFGPQQLMDASGAVIGSETRLLAAASGFSLTEVVALIHRHDGLAVAAHVNRRSFSVLSQLGAIPMEAGFDAIEVFVPAGHVGPIDCIQDIGLPILTSSDGHFVSDVGSRRTEFLLERPDFAEVALALREEGGRKVLRA